MVKFITPEAPTSGGVKFLDPSSFQPQDDNQVPPLSIEQAIRRLSLVNPEQVGKRQVQTRPGEVMPGYSPSLPEQVAGRFAAGAAQTGAALSGSAQQYGRPETPLPNMAPVGSPLNETLVRIHTKIGPIDFNWEPDVGGIVQAAGSAAPFFTTGLSALPGRGIAMSGENLVAGAGLGSIVAPSTVSARVAQVATNLLLPKLGPTITKMVLSGVSAGAMGLTYGPAELMVNHWDAIDAAFQRGGTPAVGAMLVKTGIISAAQWGTWGAGIAGMEAAAHAGALRRSQLQESLRALKGGPADIPDRMTVPPTVPAGEASIMPNGDLARAPVEPVGPSAVLSRIPVLPSKAITWEQVEGEPGQLRMAFKYQGLSAKERAQAMEQYATLRPDLATGALGRNAIDIQRLTDEERSKLDNWFLTGKGGTDAQRMYNDSKSWFSTQENAMNMRNSGQRGSLRIAPGGLEDVASNIIHQTNGDRAVGIGGAARILGYDGNIARSTWDAWMLHDYGKYGLTPEMLDKVWGESNKIAEDAWTATAKKYPSMKKLVGMANEVNPRSYLWYREFADNALEMFGNMKNATDFVNYAAYTSKNSGAGESGSNLRLAIKAYLQDKTAAPDEIRMEKPALYLGNRQSIAYRQTGEPQAGWKMGDFMGALLNKNKNNPIIDQIIHHGIMGFPRNPDGTPSAPNRTQYLLEQESIRLAHDHMWEHMDAMSPEIQRIAKEHGLDPTMLQAALWTWYQESHGKVGAGTNWHHILTNVRPELLHEAQIGTDMEQGMTQWRRPDLRMKEGVANLIKGDEQWAIVSAEGGTGDGWHKPLAGEYPTMGLIRRLAAEGYKPEQVIPARGMYQNPDGTVSKENSFIVIGMPDVGRVSESGKVLSPGASEFGREFGQYAVLTRNGLIDTTMREGGKPTEVKGFHTPLTGNVMFGEQALQNPAGWTMVHTDNGDLAFAVEPSQDAQPTIHPGILQRMGAKAKEAALFAQEKLFGEGSEGGFVRLPGRAPRPQFDGKAELQLDPGTGQYTYTDGTPMPDELAQSRLLSEMAARRMRVGWDNAAAAAGRTVSGAVPGRQPVVKELYDSMGKPLTATESAPRLLGKIARATGTSPENLLWYMGPDVNNLANAMGIDEFLTKSAKQVASVADVYRTVKRGDDPVVTAQAEADLMEAFRRHVTLMSSFSGQSKPRTQMLADLREMMATGGEALPQGGKRYNIRVDADQLANKLAGDGSPTAILGDLAKQSWKSKIVRAEAGAKLYSFHPLETKGVGDFFNYMWNTGKQELSRVMGEGAPSLEMDLQARRYGFQMGMENAVLAWNGFLRAYSGDNPYIMPGGGPPTGANAFLRAIDALTAFAHQANKWAEASFYHAREAKKEGLTGDEFNAYVAHNMMNPTPEAEAHLEEFAKTSTYTQALPRMLQWMQRTAQSTPLGKTEFPFIRVPMNAYLKGLQVDPVTGIPISLYEAGRAWWDGRQGKQVTFDPQDAIKNAIMGGMLFTTLVGFARAGYLTGPGPTDPDQFNMWHQTHEPYSVRIGNRWVNIGHFMPLASAATAAAAFSEAQQAGETVPEIGSHVLRALGHAVFDLPFVGNMSDMIQAARDPSSTAAQKALAMAIDATIPIPAFARDMRNMVDPIARAVDTKDGVLNNVIENMGNKIPFLSKVLPARSGDLTGQDKPQGAGALSPFLPASAPIPNDPFLSRMSQLGVNLPKPGRTVKLQDGRVFDIPPGEYEDMLRARYDLYKRVLVPIMGSLGDMPPADAKAYIDKALKSITGAAEREEHVKVVQRAYEGKQSPVDRSRFR